MRREWFPSPRVSLRNAPSPLRQPLHHQSFPEWRSYHQGKPVKGRNHRTSTSPTWVGRVRIEFGAFLFWFETVSLLGGTSPKLCVQWCSMIRDASKFRLLLDFFHQQSLWLRLHMGPEVPLWGIMRAFTWGIVSSSSLHQFISSHTEVLNRLTYYIISALHDIWYYKILRLYSIIFQYIS